LTFLTDLRDEYSRLIEDPYVVVRDVHDDELAVWHQRETANVVKGVVWSHFIRMADRKIDRPAENARRLRNTDFGTS
jgi:hypothetical protein